MKNRNSKIGVIAGSSWRFENLHIGTHRILAKASLKHAGLVGMAFSLSSPLGPERVQEVAHIRESLIMEGYGFVSDNQFTKTRSSIVNTPMKLPDPDMDRFDFILPIRRPEDESVYYAWDKGSLDWVLKQGFPDQSEFVRSTVMFVGDLDQHRRPSRKPIKYLDPELEEELAAVASS